jgi:hypothetical protein
MADMVYEIPGSRDKRSLAEIINRHKYDFGKDSLGVERIPPAIPMCRLVHMEVVRTLQKSSESIEQLRESFLTNGYSPELGAKFYVQPTDHVGVPLLLTEEIRSSWDPIWKEQNAAFEAECDACPSFVDLKTRMFSVFDGNHRLYSWSAVTEENPDNPKYHPRVSCVIFKGDKESMVELELAMHSVNK